MRKPHGLFFLPPESYRVAYGPAERTALAELLSISFVAPPEKPEEWMAHAAQFENVEAIFSGWFTPRMDATVLDYFPGLKVVFHAGGTVKSLVTDEFWEGGRRITCAAHANAIPVAEYALAQIILCLKHAWRSASATRAGRRFMRDDAIVPSTFGSVVGIISLGVIGRMVAERLRQLDVRLLAYDPYVSADEAAALGVERCSLEELFVRSDVVTCHTPLLPETSQLLRERHFASLKTGASFINTARGAIVHEAELVSVLANRPDLFAVLDVTDPEPPPPSCALFDLPNVLVTPHISGSIGRECLRLGRTVVEEARRYFSGHPLQWEVRRERIGLIA